MKRKEHELDESVAERETLIAELEELDKQNQEATQVITTTNYWTAELMFWILCMYVSLLSWSLNIDSREVIFWGLKTNTWGQYFSIFTIQMLNSDVQVKPTCYRQRTNTVCQLSIRDVTSQSPVK